MDNTAQQTDQLLPEFKEKLQSHGIDTTKLDDAQWREVVNSIQPLFGGYGTPNVEGGGTYDR